MKSYETEARERYGNTAAYKEHEQKTKNYTKEKWAEANDGLMAIFAEFEACKQNGAEADSNEAQVLVAKLQAHITRTTTPAQTRSSQGLARCTLPTSDSRKTSTSTATELPSLHLRRLRFTAENEHNQIQSLS